MAGTEVPSAKTSRRSVAAEAATEGCRLLASSSALAVRAQRCRVREVVVKVVVAATAATPLQLLTRETVYVVPGVRPVKLKGEPVGAGTTVVAVPPCGV